MAKHASIHAAVAIAAKVDPYKEKYGDSAVEGILAIAAGAKQRCTNANSIGFSNYGGRGIRFDFTTIRSFVEWVLDNLGPRPSAAHSIDRIDNDGPYGAGNLRWATQAQQANNKRRYKRTKRGEQIVAIKEKRPDLTYETIRTWLVQGLAVNEILKRDKYARTSL